MHRRTADIDRQLTTTAADQDGVVSARQLAAIGIRGSGLAARRERGMLHELFPRVYSVGVPPAKVERCGWEMAAQLRPRGIAVLSHASAAARLGIWEREPDAAPIHVSSHGKPSTLRPPDAPFEIVTHRRRDLPARDILPVGASRITIPARTCVDMGATHRALQVTVVIRAAVYEHGMRVGQVRRHLREHAGEPWTAIVRAALDWYDLGSAGTRSRSEDELDVLVQRAGLPTPLVNVRNATGMPGVEADFVWPVQRVVVELDGGHHALPGAPEFDRARDEQLRAAGWTVLRLHYRLVWTRPKHVIATIHRALGHCPVMSRDQSVPEHFRAWMAVVAAASRSGASLVRARSTALPTAGHVRSGTRSPYGHDS